MYCVREGNAPIPACRSEPLLTCPSAFSFLKSKECQTLSWKTTHKYTCQRRDALYDDDDRYSAREEKNLTSWLNAWTISLCTTAAAALDLANHESDYLHNHWCVSLFYLGPQIKTLRPRLLSSLHIKLKKTGHKTDAQRFTVRGWSLRYAYPVMSKTQFGIRSTRSMSRMPIHSGKNTQSS